MKIDLHIERLNVKGLQLSSSQRGLLQAAVEQELARLVDSHAGATLLGDSRATIAAQAPRLRLGQDRSPATIGRQIAQSVYGSLTSPNTRAGKMAPARDRERSHG